MEYHDVGTPCSMREILRKMCPILRQIFFGAWRIGGMMFCRERRIGMREILSKMCPILRQIFFGGRKEDRVMRGKWDGVGEEMILECHGWTSLLCVLVSMR